MKTEAGLKKYIKDWLVGLNLGVVLMDRRAMDDTTKMKAIRTYIVVDFPDGIWNEGPWFRANCTVCIGSRDKARFVADLETLDKACAKFLEQFDYNDDENGVSMIDVEFVEDYAVGSDDHECQYVFDVIAERDQTDIEPKFNR